MEFPLWLKAIGMFVLVSAFGIAYTLFKHDMGKEGQRMDEFLRWMELIWYYGRWVAIAIAAIGAAWFGINAAR